ncbi:MAG: hypothetical protein Q8L10_03825 [Candidatus Moranbacteria bacterium]|nr:hypothetical protein [Candidatus Moranbacteria bacterium]
MEKISPLHLLVIILCLIISSDALAADISGSIEYRDTVTDGKSGQKLEFYGSSIAAGKNVGISGLASIGETYAEAYIGPIWTPASWISLEAGMGFQQIESGSPLRYAIAGWIGNGIGSLYYIREMGAANEDWWEKFRALANIGKLAKLGTVYEKGCGWGPIIEISLPSSRFKFRTAWYPEPNITQIGLLLCF